MISSETFFSKRDPRAFPIWQNSVIAIAGAGGLGSNIAVSLARAGVGTLIIADFDVVSLENLNRQQFYIDQVGQTKVSALADNLNRLNPFIKLQLHNAKVTSQNLPELFNSADILIEAFDDAAAKEMLIATWLELFPMKPIIGASGIAGFGDSEAIKIHNWGNLYLVGDLHRELQEGISPIAPRVALVANMQANLALELLTKNDS